MGIAIYGVEGGEMGFFSKKTAATAVQTAPAAAAPMDLVENPRTLVLSFLHETSKTTGMRELVKNYAFQPLGDDRFLVVVDLKESCARISAMVLMARWQLLQLSVMRWAQSKGIPLAGVACTFPLDKATPLAQLKTQAQLGSEEALHSQGANTEQAKPSSQQRNSPRPEPVAAPESQIEVDHDNTAVAEEFFRLTQPVSGA